MSLADRFIRFGERIFTGQPARVSFEPMLYFFLWGAASRVVFTDDLTAIPFREVLSPWAEIAWNITSLTAPPLAFLAWWLMFKSLLPRASLAGLWVRLAADTGQFAALLTFHLATIPGDRSNESVLFERYVTAATLVFFFATIVRDVWALALTHRIAGAIYERFG